MEAGIEGALDADPRPAHRLLRAELRALRPGLPDRRHPEDHRGAEAGRRERRLRSDAEAASSIGTAFYDHGRCLPWAMATDCIVCEEFCPTSPKAICRGRRADVRATPSGAARRQVRAGPHVDPKLCIGCGACEKVCPVQDQPAVYVTSVGETPLEDEPVHSAGGSEAVGRRCWPGCRIGAAGADAESREPEAESKGGAREQEALSLDGPGARLQPARLREVNRRRVGRDRGRPRAGRPRLRADPGAGGAPSRRTSPTSRKCRRPHARCQARSPARS